MTADADWRALSDYLDRLHHSLTAAHQAGVATLSQPDFSEFSAQLQQLAQLLSEQARVLTPDLASGPVPADIRQQLERVDNDWQALLTLNQRLSVQAQRALAVLFPPDQVKAYSQLGGRRMGTVSSSTGYLKA